MQKLMFRSRDQLSCVVTGIITVYLTAVKLREYSNYGRHFRGFDFVFHIKHINIEK